MSRREPFAHPLLLSAATTLGYDEFVAPAGGEAQQQEEEVEAELVPATSGKAGALTNSVCVGLVGSREIQCVFTVTSRGSHPYGMCLAPAWEASGT